MKSQIVVLHPFPSGRSDLCILGWIIAPSHKVDDGFRRMQRTGVKSGLVNFVLEDVLETGRSVNQQEAFEILDAGQSVSAAKRLKFFRRDPAG